MEIDFFLWGVGTRQVVLRMKPLKGGEAEDDLIVQKISSNSVSVLDHTFTYDSVADTRSTQVSLFLCYNFAVSS